MYVMRMVVTMRGCPSDQKLCPTLFPTSLMSLEFFSISDFFSLRAENPSVVQERACTRRPLRGQGDRDQQTACALKCIYSCPNKNNAVIFLQVMKSCIEDLYTQRNPSTVHRRPVYTAESLYCA